MPFLPEEPTHAPADLFDPVNQPLAPSVWWVAHTRPRQEKSLARDRLALKIPFYLPCERKAVRVRNTVRKVNYPVFSGYLFYMAIPEERWRTTGTGRIASVQEVFDQVRFLADLRRVRALLDLGRPVVAEMCLQVGTPVTLRDGPMAGYTGVVIKQAGGFKFVVEVQFIQRALSVTVDGEWLGLPS